MCSSKSEGNGKETLTKQSDVSDFGFCWGVKSNDDKDDTEGWEELVIDLDWTRPGTHSSGEEWANTNMIVFSEEGMYIVVLTNTSDNPCDALDDVFFELLQYRAYLHQANRL